MPIDPLAQRVSQEQALSQFVSGRNVEDELSRIKRNVETLRGRFSERSGELISRSGQSGRSSIAARTPELESEINAILARKRMGLQKQKMEAIFNNAFDLAVRYGMDETSAQQYARTTAEQLNEQEFQSTEADKRRAQARKLNELTNQYGTQRLALEDEFAPSGDYSPQILGGILGVGSDVIFDKFLRGKYAGRKKKRFVPARIKGSKAEDYMNLRDYPPLGSGSRYEDYQNIPDYYPSGDFSGRSRTEG